MLLNDRPIFHMVQQQNTFSSCDGRKCYFSSVFFPGADVISFDGHGVISYRFRSKKLKIVKDVISLKFRTTSGDGVLLHGEGQQGDYISLELRRARLQLSINLGRLTKSSNFLQGSVV